MYATVTQPKTDQVHHQSIPARTLCPAAPNPAVERIAAAFTEQHGTGRWEELAKTLDVPLDFQI